MCNSCLLPTLIYGAEIRLDLICALKLWDEFLKAEVRDVLMDFSSFLFIILYLQFRATKRYLSGYKQNVTFNTRDMPPPKHFFLLIFESIISAVWIEFVNNC
jgi:hypothetical protein